MLDYQSTQLKLVPILATAYCLHFTKDHLVRHEGGGVLRRGCGWGWGWGVMPVRMYRVCEFECGCGFWPFGDLGQGAGMERHWSPFLPLLSGQQRHECAA